MNEVEEYVNKNEDKLQRLAKHGEPTIRSMALAILKVAGEQDRDN